MNVGANRLDTFLNYQPLWPYINNTNYHSPEEFVNAGFYNVSTKRMIDKVQCYLCDITLADWKQEQSPLDRHTLTSTQCPLVILNFFDNSMTSLDNDAYPESEHMLKARLKTFTKNTTWPPLDITSNTQRRRTTRSSSRQKVIPSAEKMAEAGFIFTPTLDCPDRVKCPYCQYHLGDLQNTINPWLLHEQSNPSCLFVTRRRSNMRLKSSLVLQKRGLIPEISSRSLYTVSTPSLSKRRRSATNASTKTTPKTQDGSVNSTEKGNSCHGGGNGGNPVSIKGGDNIKRSAINDTIWDIDNVNWDYGTTLATKKQRPSLSNQKSLITYSKRQRKTSTKITSRTIPLSPKMESNLTATKTATPSATSPPKQQIETAGQLLIRLQKIPITRITFNDKGKGRAIEESPARATASRTTKRLGRDSLRLSTKKRPSSSSSSLSPSSSSSSTSHAAYYINSKSNYLAQCNYPPTKVNFSPSSSSSSSSLHGHGNHALDLTISL